MKNNRYMLVSFCILFLLSGCGNTRINNYNENTPITTFILGKWRFSHQINDLTGTYQEEYFVKFGNRGKLMFCHKTPYDTSCGKFVYAHITNNQVSLENKRALNGKWQLERQGDNLEICFLNDIGECYVFTRDISRYNLFLEFFGMYW
jgi:hypothetical protein